ncbi:two component transcriptional regulator, winged helix family [Paludibacter propionicigenes WB4]|uniref:Two component transcriptional regulator, winged helix family n=1 Tax=Paludibacter propionicigenes (strain DSM 17365 / JCM 13257 / WB4) TaxID=694427 RepID=E4T4S5_PALPW|nr:response regulator transcription factor [Paludibacter propionicigenes]ADQ79719.1 two component transcriptional regulator, winged helix family [Paludibacter propionicigenes WB4]
MKHKILLVEDDFILGETLKDFFESNGLSVAWAQDGNMAIKYFNNIKPELILLDVILPEKDGFEVIAEIRKSNTIVPIIFMTGTQFEAPYQIKGYKLGAVNYLRKPIVPQVVLAQINSILSPITARRYKFENLHIIIDNQLLVINNTEIIVREKESKLFVLLLNNQHKVLSRNDILLAIWGDNSYNLNNVLDSTISHLKKSLTAFPALQIVSVYGNGYKLTINTNI